MTAQASTPAEKVEPRSRLARVKDVLALAFVGDWHPVLRDPLDFVRVSFVVGAAYFALAGDWDAAIRLFLPGVLVLVVRALNVHRVVDWIFCIAMLFQGWGNALHLFTEVSWYDNTVHITLPMSLAPILYVAFSRLDVVPDLAERTGSEAQLAGMVLVTLCLGVTAASFYEIYEWVVNNWFGQHLFTS